MAVGGRDSPPRRMARKSRESGRGGARACRSATATIPVRATRQRTPARSRAPAVAGLWPMPFSLLGKAAAVPRELVALLRLPRGVLWFYSRALVGAVRRQDRWSLTSATRPHALAKLLSVAENSTRVVELGTGTGWTAVSLALANSRRRVVTYDPNIHPQRDFYLQLVDEETRRRVEIRHGVGEAGPASGEEVDLVFIDSGHSSRVTVASFVAWEPSVVPGGIVAFHDYGNPSYPGVKAAVDELGLEGELFGNLWTWRKES
jgi:hypothetical protein